MKKLFIIIGLLFALIVPVYAKDIPVYVDGEMMSFPDQKPVLDSNGRVQIPVRFPAEAFGAGVEWIPSSRTVIVTRNGKTVELTIGSKDYKLNGNAAVMDTKALIVNGRTMVPIRFISEGLGLNVEWKNSSVYITSGDSDEYIEDPYDEPSAQEPEIPQWAKEMIAGVAKEGEHINPYSVDATFWRFFLEDGRELIFTAEEVANFASRFTTHRINYDYETGMEDWAVTYAKEFLAGEKPAEEGLTKWALENKRKSSGTAYFNWSNVYINNSNDGYFSVYGAVEYDAYDGKGLQKEPAEIRVRFNLDNGQLVFYKVIW